jgi:hypothetical protein
MKTGPSLFFIGLSFICAAQNDYLKVPEIVFDMKTMTRIVDSLSQQDMGQVWD